MAKARNIAEYFVHCYGADARERVERIARDLVAPGDAAGKELWAAIRRIVATVTTGS